MLGEQPLMQQLIDVTFKVCEPISSETYALSFAGQFGGVQLLLSSFSAAAPLTKQIDHVNTTAGETSAALRWYQGYDTS